MTRRAKLHAVFEAAVDRGATVEDLLNHIEAFTASGKSGIESFLDAMLATLQEQPDDPCSQLKEAVWKAETVIEDLLAALDDAVN